jgi:hypothetical protein
MTACSIWSGVVRGRWWPAACAAAAGTGYGLIGGDAALPRAWHVIAVHVPAAIGFLCL